ALKAIEMLLGAPEGLLASAIIGPVEPPDVLGLILMHRKETSLLETALLHESLTAEWMERVIPSLPGKVLEIPLNNQVMWMDRPRILDLLEFHPEAEYQIKRRVNEFRFEVLRLIPEEVVQDRLAIIDEVEAGRLDKAWAELPVPEETPEAEETPEDQAKLQEQFAKPILDEDGQEIPLSLTQRVLRLRTNQKIILALRGGKEERTLLIREANRLVQVNVIRNGRITEGEVAYIAQMRSVNEEVLRIISQNREWMKKYTITKNLVQNPKTPLAIALNHLKRIHEFDLKIMVNDRNMADLLRREAKRMVSRSMN
ncbi:MAG TPA: hypothetical protein VN436_09850, partial [Holophaga sp.]|nr:hypothetical protein [Holophaga sp.]